LTSNLTSVAALLGLAPNEMPNYFAAIRALADPALTPSNRDIAEAVSQLGRNTAPQAIAARAQQLALLRRTARSSRPVPHINSDRLRSIVSRPLNFPRCGCGRPAMPGDSSCYTCSS
jgi:hypothetical protein